MKTNSAGSEVSFPESEPETNLPQPSFLSLPRVVRRESLAVVRRLPAFAYLEESVSGAPADVAGSFALPAPINSVGSALPRRRTL